MKIDRLDHLVLTVRDLDVAERFYEGVLGMTPIRFEGRRALRFGDQKINLHLVGHEISPHAHRATPGSADLCFIVNDELDAIVAHLQSAGVPVELGPVDRTGATGKLRSVYVRDPDGNLIELSRLV